MGCKQSTASPHCLLEPGFEAGSSMGDKQSTRYEAESEVGDKQSTKFKVVVLGDDYTGKQSAIWRLTGEGFYESIRLCGMRDPYSRIRSVCLDDTEFKVHLWYISCHMSCHDERVYRGADGFIMLYDVTYQESFDNMPHWIEQAMKYGPPGATVMMVGAKSDLSEEKVVFYETARDFVDKRNIQLCFEVSAKDETNMELALGVLVAKIRESQQYRSLC